MELCWWNRIPAHLHDEWNALVSAMESPEIFFTWQWASAVADAFDGELQPLIATAHDQENLIGIAAFASLHSGDVVFLAGSTADYCDFISAPESRREFLTQVIADLKSQGHRNIVLASLPAESRSVHVLKTSPQFHCFLRPAYHCPQVHLGSETEKKSLLSSLRKKKMLRRSIAALKSKGDVSFRITPTASLSEQEVRSFFQMHIARFLRTGRLSNLAQAKRREFMAKLARLTADSGWCELMSLQVAQESIAHNFGFNFCGKRFWYQPTFHNDWEEFSPGYSLLGKIIEESCQDASVAGIDLGLGAEEYKERFANDSRSTLHATLSRSMAAALRVRTRYYLAQAIKKSQKLETAARNSRALLKRFEQRVRTQGALPTFRYYSTRLHKLISSKDEVLFFRWPGTENEQQETPLSPLSWEILASTAMRCENDSETLEYLKRAAPRLKKADCRGFAIVAVDRSAEHILWAAPYEAFAMAELNTVLGAPSPSSRMIFDCWTPAECRGRGLYTKAIRSLARQISNEGADAWIFSAAENVASAAGIRNAGFELEFSMVRRRTFGWARVQQKLSGLSLERRVKEVSEPVQVAHAITSEGEERVSA